MRTTFIIFYLIVAAVLAIAFSSILPSQQTSAQMMNPNTMGPMMMNPNTMGPMMMNPNTMGPMMMNPNTMGPMMGFR